MGLVSKEKLSKAFAVHTVEAMKIVLGMIKGTFHFNPLSQNEIKSPITQNINFEKLFRNSWAREKNYYL